MSTPTKGATEDAATHWAASPNMARLVRLVIFVTPIVGAWLIVRLVSDHLYRPAHPLGVVLWALQAIVIASSTSLLIDRIVARFLPLASLLGLSLVFPDQAPSRFGIALRTGTIRKLEAHLAEASERGLDPSEATAAREAIELVTLLGRHERLTRGHTERVRAYSELIAREMGIDDAGRQRLAWAALLHDIGKLTVPSYILNSDGRPTDEEWEILRGHPAAGEAFVEPLAEWLGEWKGATSEHHERWDGGGYPRGLAGTEISLAGRIVAAADAYDVITSKRSYKSAMSAETARAELVRCAGTQFDPDVVRALLKVSLDDRKPRSIIAWLIELLRLDRIAQAVAVAPAATVIGLASLGSLVGLTDASASEAPEQLAFVAPDPSFDDDLDLGPDGRPTRDDDALATTDVVTGDEGSGGAPTDGRPGAPDPTATDGEPGDDEPGDGNTPTTTGPPVSSPPVTLPEVTIPGVSTPITTPPRLTIPDITLPPLITTTTTVPTTTTTAPTTTTTTAPPVGPNARNDVHSTVLGLVGTIPVLSNDSAGSTPLDSGTLRIVSPPGIGTATVNGSNINFRVTSILFISTSFSYEICDTNGLCDQATVTVIL